MPVWVTLPLAILLAGVLGYFLVEAWGITGLLLSSLFGLVFGLVAADISDHY